MTTAVTSMTIGLADAGQQARAVRVARVRGQDPFPPTFQLLRS